MRDRVYFAALAIAVNLAIPGAPALAQAAAAAAAPPIPIESFAQNSNLSSPILSPDGQHVALITYPQGKRVLAVVDAVTRKPVRTISLNPEITYKSHRWAGNDRILISVSQKTLFMGDEIRVSRLAQVDLANGQLSFVGPDSMGPEGDDLLWVAPDGSRALLSYQRTIYDWPSVFMLNLADPKDRGKQVQRAETGIWNWYADDAGVVRMGTGYVDRRLKVIYRSNGEEAYRTVARIREDDQDEQWWHVSQIKAGSDDAIVLDEQDDGRIVLAHLNLATRTPGAVIYRNDKWDVDEAYIDNTGVPVAVDFTDERDRRVWLDPVLGKLQTKLEAAFRGDKALASNAVWMGSASQDKTRMLVFSGGESDPGAWYLYDATKRSLDLFGETRPKLPFQALAKPKAITYTARDGTPITGFLTLPPGRAATNLPLIVMPHGGPYGVRDRLTYDDDVQLLASRGYAVLQPNYRGSGGYGSAFSDLGEGQIGRKMQDDLDDAMDWAVAQGIAAKDRVCMVGASYGGYAAMWAVIRNPERYRCAASFAGVTDWKKILKYDAQFFSRKNQREWTSRIRGEEDVNLDEYAPVKTIDRLTRPLLVAQGKEDDRVPYSQYTALKAAAAKAGKPVEYLEFADEGHGFAKPENRAKWYATLLDFLARNNPPG